MAWRRRHDMDFRAMEILYSPPSADKITNLDDWWRERHILTRRLIAEKRYKSAYNLVSKHVQKDGVNYAEAEFLAGWLALEFLNQPWKAFEHFERLYYKTSTPISRSRGAYWAARASDALGDKEVARQWYRVAAQHQVAFYGQMALAILAPEDQPPQQVPPERTLKGQRLFEQWDMVRLVRLLDKAGQSHMSDRFLEAVLAAVQTPEQYRMAAELATDIHHYHMAVKIARVALQKNILLIDHAYPTIVSRLQSIDLEWALVHGLIRQESGFDAEIQSPAGARGLMQLMPSTANLVARHLGIAHRTSWLTSKPDHNIILGSAYLAQMLGDFDGSYPLAVAAYNAGPNRVRRWLKEYGDPRKGEVNMVNWIEMIPVGETRNYVQRVLESTYIYRIKLKNVQDRPDALLHVAYKQP